MSKIAEHTIGRQNMLRWIDDAQNRMYDSFDEKHQLDWAMCIARVEHKQSRDFMLNMIREATSLRDKLMEAKKEFATLFVALTAIDQELDKTMINHADMVKALAKNGATIAAELTAKDAHLLHMAVGISGESGELLDAVKKAVIYRKPLDRDNVIEELGDLEFYMEGIRQGLGLTRDECIAANIAKLGKRYGEVYSDAAAQERADKPNFEDRDE